MRLRGIRLSVFHPPLCRCRNLHVPYTHITLQPVVVVLFSTSNRLNDSTAVISTGAHLRKFLLVRLSSPQTHHILDTPQPKTSFPTPSMHLPTHHLITKMEIVDHSTWLTNKVYCHYLPHNRCGVAENSSKFDEDEANRRSCYNISAPTAPMSSIPALTIPKQTSCACAQEPRRLRKRRRPRAPGQQR